MTGAGSGFAQGHVARAARGGFPRVKSTGTDLSAEGSFTITLFKGPGQTPEATLMGTASSVEPGRIVTVDLISTDKYHSGHYRHEFQKDF